MNTALVCGADGFIGSHLVARLKEEGYYVRAVGRRSGEFLPPGTKLANEYHTADLRSEVVCKGVVRRGGLPFDEVYQLAAEMGGMGYISSSECDIMRNSCLVNLHMIHSAAEAGVRLFFFSSSACVYHDQGVGDLELAERDAYPAYPDNEYGWEKLFSERVLQAYGRKYPMEVRIGRFQNTYGPDSHWSGIRAKAPAAMCRKVIECPPGGTIEIWGNGRAMRAYTFISDTIDGIRVLMQARPVDAIMHDELSEPYNIGRREYVSVDQLAQEVISISGKTLKIQHVPGPEGVRNRGFRADRIAILGWESKVSLRDGLTETYRWVEEQIKKQSHPAHGSS